MGRTAKISQSNPSIISKSSKHTGRIEKTPRFVNDHERKKTPAHIGLIQTDNTDNLEKRIDELMNKVTTLEKRQMYLTILEYSKLLDKIPLTTVDNHRPLVSNPVLTSTSIFLEGEEIKFSKDALRSSLEFLI